MHARDALWLLLLFISSGCSSSDSFVVAPGPYLGQPPPNTTPSLFAPGIVTTGYHEHSSPAFSPDGSEVYWSVFYNFWGPQVIVFMRQENGVWSPPRVAPFSGQYHDGGPCFSPDGRKLYFESRRPHTLGGDPTADIDLWAVERTSQGWGEPKRLGPEINTDQWERGPSFSDNGTLYFQSMRDGGYGAADIYRAEPTDGGFSKAVNLGSTINTPNYESWPGIAPDESYLLYEAHHEGLVISFKKPDGTWGKPTNVLQAAKVRGGQVRFPRLSNDGKYLFFVSNSRDGDAWFEKRLSLDDVKARATRPGNGYGDVYWVDASFISELRYQDERSSN